MLYPKYKASPAFTKSSGEPGDRGEVSIGAGALVGRHAAARVRGGRDIPMHRTGWPLPCAPL